MSEKDYKAVAEQLARLVMQMIEGDDMAYGKAAKLVQKHFPDVHEEYS